MGVALEVVWRSRGGLARLLRKLGDLEQRFHDLNRLATFLGLLARDEALGLLPPLEGHHPPTAGTRLQADGGVRPRGDRRIILVGNERLDATFGRLSLSEIHGRVHDVLRDASAALVRVCCCPSRAAPVAVQQPAAAVASSSSSQQRRYLPLGLRVGERHLGCDAVEVAVAEIAVDAHLFVGLR